MPSQPIVPTSDARYALKPGLHRHVVGRVRARKKVGAEHSALIC
jgi:hypothetical protein